VKPSRRAAVLAAATCALLGILIVFGLGPDRIARAAVLAGEGGLTGVRVMRPEPDEVGTLESCVPPLGARWYRPVGDPVAAVVLVHGNRSTGGGHPLYRLLARALADRGALVVAVDLRGYGESSPVPEDDPLTADDFVRDVECALIELRGRVGEDVPVGAVGHSIGANVVLKLERRRDLRRIAIEPGTDLSGRVIDPPAPRLDSFTRKLNRNVRGPAMDREAVRALYRALDPESGPGGTAGQDTLVVQGWNVPESTRESIERSARAQGGALLVRLDSGHHEFGVLAIGRRVAYPSSVIARLVDAIFRFLIASDGTGNNS
jgi:pimeloyl-ACP methyl ester carboxylesterase